MVIFLSFCSRPMINVDNISQMKISMLWDHAWPSKNKFKLVKKRFTKAEKNNANRRVKTMP